MTYDIFIEAVILHSYAKSKIGPNPHEMKQKVLPHYTGAALMQVAQSASLLKKILRTWKKLIYRTFMKHGVECHDQWLALTIYILTHDARGIVNSFILQLEDVVQPCTIITSNELTATFGPHFLYHTHTPSATYILKVDNTEKNAFEPARIYVGWHSSNVLQYFVYSRHNRCACLTLSSLHLTLPSPHLANTTQSALEPHAAFHWKPSSKLTLA